MADYAQWWKRSSFATEHFKRKFLNFIARLVGGILCVTNEHSRSEMTSNIQTNTQTNTPNYSYLAAHVRRG